MALMVGILLALGVGAFATVVGFDRERSFYPTVMIVIASYYVLFAVMGGSMESLVMELIVAAGFVAVAAYGFRRSLWLVVAALAAHGVQDFFHGHLVGNPGMPVWWPQFCGAYDVAAAAYLSWLLYRGNLRAASSRRADVRRTREQDAAAGLGAVRR